MAYNMNKEIRIGLICTALSQIPAEGLNRIIEYEGEILLDGNILSKMVSGYG